MLFKRCWVGVLCVGLASAGCGDDDGGGSAPDAGAPDAGVTGGPVEPFPDKSCPGGDACATGDGVLRVGAARVAITPALIESEWDDSDGDHVFSPGDAFTDVNGNDEFDAVWIAGSQNGRAAAGVHDDVWARAIVIEVGDTRIAFVALDLIGWFIDEIEDTRAMLPAELALDHVIVAATHNHQSPDTMGLWGLRELESGIDPDYQVFVQQKTVEAVTAAVADLQPARLTIAATKTVDESGSARPYVGDVRDPIIFDPTITLLQFASADDPATTIATLVHWAAHPEYVWFDNNLLSSDYIHFLRETIELGAPDTAAGPAEPGLGGEVVFVNGAMGGQVGPIVARPIGPDGEEIRDGGFAKAEAAGTNVGRLALQALSSADIAEDVDAPALAFRTGAINVAVENVFYHVGGLVGVFDRQFFGYDTSEPIGDDNIPYIASRVTFVQLGPVGIITCPGELHPELFIGGYDGSESYGQDIVAEDNPNPPLLANAPQGPYLRDLMLDVPGVRYPLLFGLAEDTLGYIVPAWNYVLDDSTPYLEEATGDHYEETNSVGPGVEREVVGAMRALIQSAR